MCIIFVQAKLFHCWINTFFLHHAPPFQPEGPGAVEVVRPVHRSAKGEDTPCPLHAFIVTLTRGELDAVNKEIASGDLEVSSPSFPYFAHVSLRAGCLATVHKECKMYLRSWNVIP